MFGHSINLIKVPAAIRSAFSAVIDQNKHVSGESMKLKVLKQRFSVCKIPDITKIKLHDPYFFMAQTTDELSLVCLTTSVPENATDREDGWQGFYIEGIIDFALTGILSGILTPLADEGIGIFAVSTFNTDYIFVKEKAFVKALDVLAAKGYKIDKSNYEV